MTDQRIRSIALFASLCLFLSLVELMIPKPIPFFRLGLANLPILLALLLFPAGEFLLIVVLKVLGQAIITGTLLSYVVLFSASGSFASALVMLLLKKGYGRYINLVGIGVFAAFASNLLQLGVSALFIFGESTRLFAPVFLLMGSVTGFLIGFIAEVLKKRSKWIAAVGEKIGDDEHRGLGGKDGKKRGEEGEVFRAAARSAQDENYKDPSITVAGEKPHFFALFRLIIGVALIPPFLLHSELWVKSVQLLLCILAAVSVGRKFRPAPGLVVFVAVATAHLFMPVGKVLTELLDFPITLGALQMGVNKGLTLVGLVFISRFAVSKELRIPGTAGRLLYDVLFFFEELTAFRPMKERDQDQESEQRRRQGSDREKGKKAEKGIRNIFRRLKTLAAELDSFLLSRTFSVDTETEPSVAAATEWSRPIEVQQKEKEKRKNGLQGAWGKRTFSHLILPIAFLLLQWGVFFTM